MLYIFAYIGCSIILYFLGKYFEELAEKKHSRIIRFAAILIWLPAFPMVLAAASVELNMRRKYESKYIEGVQRAADIAVLDAMTDSNREAAWRIDSWRKYGTRAPYTEWRERTMADYGLQDLKMNFTSYGDDTSL